MNKIDTIVFDLGGVLIDWNPDYVFRHLLPDEQERKWFFDNVCTPDWNEEQDGGRSIAEGTELLIKKFPEHESSISAFYGRWQEMLGGPIQGTVDILKQLVADKNLNLFALTNWSAETFPVALTKFEFLHWFHGRMVSGEEKTRKPFPDIYHKLITRFNIIPSKAVYIDDNIRNLHPAKELGFHVIHFQNPPQLRDELSRLGLTVDGGQLTEY
jgi:2-haloacid dehalogenase